MGNKNKKIRKNILDYLSTNKKKVLVDSVSKLSQIYLSKKFNSIVFFNYCPEIEKFLNWCQQLIAESLGKNKKGLMPIISSAPKDQHSLLQLYLDGPRDKLFYIISSNYSKKLKTKHYLFENKLDYLNNKKIIKIIEAQKNSFIKILQKKKIPFREFKINETSEESIGEMFSYFIIETALIGIISGVNPYNQPGVEELKVLTKKFLS
jgi:glucose-6-phosphate isomerase